MSDYFKTTPTQYLHVYLILELQVVRTSGPHVRTLTYTYDSCMCYVRLDISNLGSQDLPPITIECQNVTWTKEGHVCIYIYNSPETSPRVVPLRLYRQVMALSSSKVQEARADPGVVSDTSEPSRYQYQTSLVQGLRRVYLS